MDIVASRVRPLPPPVVDAPAREARRLSTLTVSAIEGALILSRVETSAAPIEDVAKSLGTILKRDTPSRRRTS